MRVALFITCLADTLFPEAGRATVALLERLEVEVVFPEGQTCCGQMHANTGYRRHATVLARRFVDVFSDADADAIVCPSASCAAMVKDQYPELAQRTGNRELVDAVSRLVPRVHELSQFLVSELGVEDVGAYFPHRVTYHPTCHSLRLLRVGDAPSRLLRAVRGIDLVELPEADTCCGFGGTFAIKNSDTSTAMLTDKLRAILATGAEVCTAADSSCLMHVGGGLARARAGVRTIHIAEILAATQAHSA
jgi:L-lactate dehydrogenase complex protein LldE